MAAPRCQRPRRAAARTRLQEVRVKVHARWSPDRHKTYSGAMNADPARLPVGWRRQVVDAVGDGVATVTAVTK